MLKELNNLPIIEQQVPAKVAKPWFQVTEQKNIQLEGLAFDRQRYLYFVSPAYGKIYQLNLTTKKLKIILDLGHLGPTGLVVDQKGDPFIACYGNMKNSGCLLAFNPKTKKTKTIISQSQGYVIDDLVFDSSGGFYFTDFKSPAYPNGGIYYMDSAFQTITPITKHLFRPNGIALSPNQKEIWVTETGENDLKHIQLAGKNQPQVSPEIGINTPYHFSGLTGADSCCTDTFGNVYIAMYNQGRVLIFNPQGNLIQQILMPNRQNGRMLRTSHPAIMPNTHTLLICTDDVNHNQGSWLFSARTFGKSLSFF